MPPKRRTSNDNAKEQPVRKSPRKSTASAPSVTSSTSASKSKATKHNTKAQSSSRKTQKRSLITNASQRSNVRLPNTASNKVPESIPPKVATRNPAVAAKAQEAKYETPPNSRHDLILTSNSDDLESNPDLPAFEPRDMLSDDDGSNGDVFVKTINRIKPGSTDELSSDALQSQIVYNKTNTLINDAFLGFTMSNYRSAVRFAAKCLHLALIFDNQTFNCIYSADPKNYVVADSKTVGRGRIHLKDGPEQLLFGLFVVLQSNLRAEDEATRALTLIPHGHGWIQSLNFYDQVGQQAISSKTIQGVSGDELVFSTGYVEIEADDDEKQYETGLQFRPPKVSGSVASPSKKTVGGVKLTPTKRGSSSISSSSTKALNNAKPITPVIRLIHEELSVDSPRFDVNKWGPETLLDVDHGDLLLVGFEAKMMAFPFNQKPKHKYVTHTLRFIVRLGECEENSDSD